MKIITYSVAITTIGDTKQNSAISISYLMKLCIHSNMALSVNQKNTKYTNIMSLYTVFD